MSLNTALSKLSCQDQPFSHDDLEYLDPDRQVTRLGR